MATDHDDQRSLTDNFIVDNSDPNTQALEYLRQWCEIADSADIATGHFEIGSLLALDGHWQKLDKLRILIGGDTSKKTKSAVKAACEARAREMADSFKPELDTNPLLDGDGGGGEEATAAIVEAMKSGKIEVRVYTKRKFHAKTYITHGTLPVVGSAAMVGSSNFTRPGLTQNVELNVRFGGAEVRDLQEWFEQYWSEAEPVTPELLQVIETRAQEWTPFDIWAKALRDLTEGVDASGYEWEREESSVFKALSRYQREGYYALRHMANSHSGGFLTDGVGLGKTLVGLMLAEYYAQKERLNVLVMATRTGVDLVWNPSLKRFAPELEGEFSRVKILAHTDLTGVKSDPLTASLAREVDVVIVDEAHHFRNRGRGRREGDDNRSRWHRMQEICEGKKVFLLTATPINNSLHDLRHEAQLFTGDSDDYFAASGVPSLRKAIVDLENSFTEALDSAQDDAPGSGFVASTMSMSSFRTQFSKHPLFPELIHQTSRKYAIESSKAEGEDVLFPESAMPRAIDYELTLESSALLDEMEKAFKKHNPLFTLPMYYPLAYWDGKEPVDRLKQNRQSQVVGLIRTTFLKRFESSLSAFAGSSIDLTGKILAWMKLNASDPDASQRLSEWIDSNREAYRALDKSFRHGSGGLPEGFGGEGAISAELDDPEEDLLEEEIAFGIEEDKLSPDDYDLEKMFEDAYADLEQLREFVEQMLNVDVEGDEKYKHLRMLLDPDASRPKGRDVFEDDFQRRPVIVFTEFADTARYLAERLKKDGVEGVERLDGSSNLDRKSIIHRFAPFYNGVDKKSRTTGKPIRILISTDVLSEGVNLHDSNLLVNYDLHWNPVRLMQRIGRVDRRRDAGIEAALCKETGISADDRAEVKIRNFLPTDAVETLLGLYERAGNRAVLISLTLGIPGGRLFTKDDMLDDVKVISNLREERDEQLSVLEELRLEYTKMCKADADLDQRLDDIPLGAGSSRSVPEDGVPGLFMCIRRPEFVRESDEEPGRWDLDSGSIQWAFEAADGEVISGLADETLDFVASSIRTKPGTERAPIANRSDLKQRIIDLEKTLEVDFHKRSQVPQDAPHSQRICWMVVE